MAKPKTKKKKSVFEFEVGLSVSEYEGDFESCKEAYEDALIVASDELLEAGVAQADIHRTNMDVRFVEFDSGNPSHAGGMFHITVTGPKELVEKMEKFWNKWME